MAKKPALAAFGGGVHHWALDCEPITVADAIIVLNRLMATVKPAWKYRTILIQLT